LTGLGLGARVKSKVKGQKSKVFFLLTTSYFLLFPSAPQLT
jgi:hypothetical protein